MKPLCLLALTIFFFSSCSVFSSKEVPQSREYPFVVEELPHSSDGIPLLNVWLKDENLMREMDVETYLEGVVAGEMPNTWPLEALEAQAILARTFVMKFVSEKESRYSGADISTDIAEAQAYDASAINERVRQAVANTAGQVLLDSNDELPYTWFHAHSGGQTALAQEALGWHDAEPSYTKVTAGMDSDAAPANTRFWSASFSAEDFLDACHRLGLDIQTVDSVSIKEKGQSGRAVTLAVNDLDVNAAALRLELGSVLMRSTLLTDLQLQDGRIAMSGKGYGHGVGMSQWGAYALAQNGWSGEEIALYYYQGLHIAKIW